MKNSIIALILLVGFGLNAFGQESMIALPKVKGLVRLVDHANQKIKIKHEAIPNLNMPAMTMSFAVQDPTLLQDLAPGDQILFSADEINGATTIMWIEKQSFLSSTLLCTGVGATFPPTSLEFEIRPFDVKFSTVRYEIMSHPLAGTAYIQSLGRMKAYEWGPYFIYMSGSGRLDSRLVVRLEGNQIVESWMTHYSSGLRDAPVECSVSSF